MGKITISDSGQVQIPATIAMRDFEIADMLDLMVPTVRGAIKRLLKSRMGLDCSGGIVSGRTIIPEYFGLDVVIAIAFQCDSYHADIFRKWVIYRLLKGDIKPIYIDFNDIRNSIYS